MQFSQHRSAHQQRAHTRRISEHLVERDDYEVWLHLRQVKPISGNVGGRIGRGAEPGQACVEGHRLGKLLNPERRRCAVTHALEAHGMSERRACHLVNQPRGTQRYQPTQRDDEDALTRAVIELASQYGRYGYRRRVLPVEAANSAVRFDPEFRKEYAHRCHQKHRAIAKVAAARKLAIRLYWMLRTQTPYPKVVTSRAA